jgi:ParB family chromosome partitioning protein
MPEEARPSRLGRGLAALIGDAGDAQPSGSERARNARRVPVEFVRPNPRNPRRAFSDAELEQLAASISERGVIQPIVVRNVPGASGQFEIIAGERRWRAAQRAGLHDVPIVVVEASDRESLEFAIIENVQRADLNPVEEAMGYAALMGDFSYSQDEVAKIVGKSRPHISNMLRLLKLSDSIKAHLASGALTAGHARMLVGQPNADALAAEIVERGLNVRQVEALARESGKAQGKTQRKAERGGGSSSRGGAVAGKDPDTIALEKRVSDVLGLTVTVDHSAAGGTLHIRYKSLDQLEDVLKRLERRQ